MLSAWIPAIFTHYAATSGVSRGNGDQAVSNSRGEPPLQGRKVLVIEDESLIALLITDVLEAAGAEVVGPCYTLGECMKLISSENFDSAILDVDLAGVDVFPAAEELKNRGIPFLFHTAHGERQELQSRFGDIPVCRKPTVMHDLVDVLGRFGHRPKAS